MQQPAVEIKPSDPLIVFVGKLFLEIPSIVDNSGNKVFQSDGYVILSSSVVCRLLYDLYLKFIKTELKPIEMLSNEEKNIYWLIAKRYYTDQNQAIKASKAAYILKFITT